MPQETCRQFLEIANFLPWLIKRLRAQGMDYNKASEKSFGVLVAEFKRQSAVTRCLLNPDLVPCPGGLCL